MIFLIVFIPIYSSSVYAVLQGSISSWNGIPGSEQEGYDYHYQSQFTPSEEVRLTWNYDLDRFKLNIGTAYSRSGSINDILSWSYDAANPRFTEDDKEGTLVLPAGDTYYLYAFPLGTTLITPTVTYESTAEEVLDEPVVCDWLNNPDSCSPEELDAVADSCVRQHTKQKDLIDVFDSDTVSVLATIITVLMALCTVISLIKTITAALLAAIGGSLDCKLSYAGLAICSALESLDESIQAIYGHALKQTICDFANCRCPLPAYANFPSNFACIAMAPLFAPHAWETACFPALIVNMRKTAQIYKVHNCCVEQACREGYDVKICQSMFDQAMCMEWEAGLLVGLYTGIISFVIQLVTEEIVDADLPYIVRAIIQVVAIPIAVIGLVQTVTRVVEEFDEPDCPDVFSGAGVIQRGGRDPWPEEELERGIATGIRLAENPIDYSSLIAIFTTETPATAVEEARLQLIRDMSATGLDLGTEFELLLNVLVSGELDFETGIPLGDLLNEASGQLTNAADLMSQAANLETAGDSAGASELRSRARQEYNDALVGLEAGTALREGLVGVADSVEVEAARKAAEETRAKEEAAKREKDAEADRKRDLANQEFGLAVGVILGFLSGYLNEWALGEISELCEESYESSDPSSTDTGDLYIDSPVTVDEDNFCMNYNNVFTGEVLAEVSQTGTSENPLFTYDYYYNIINCDQAAGTVPMRVWLNGTTIRSLNTSNVPFNAGPIEEAQSVESDRIYTDICVTMLGYLRWGDNGLLCVPIVSGSS